MPLLDNNPDVELETIFDIQAPLAGELLDSNLDDELEKRGNQQKELITRSMGVLYDLSVNIPIANAHQILINSQTDFDVLAGLLSTPDALDLMLPDKPLLKAKFRGLQKKKELLNSEGGCITTQETAELLGISRQAVNKRIESSSLIGIRMPRHGYIIPIWQFGANAISLEGLKETLQELHDVDPWGQFIFFLTEAGGLNGKRPLDALKEGRLEDVIRAAQAYGEQGAA